MTIVRLMSVGAAHGLIESLHAELAAQSAELVAFYGPAGTVEQRTRNDGTDAVILPDAALEKLARDGLCHASSIARIGFVRAAIATPVAASPIAINDLPALLDALRAAPAIFLPDSSLSTAGKHFRSVLKSLGIWDSIMPRVVEHPSGAAAMRALAECPLQGALGCTQETEILSTEGLKVEGHLPGLAALSTSYAIALTDQGRANPAARALCEVLCSPASNIFREASGFYDAPSH